MFLVTLPFDGILSNYTDELTEERCFNPYAYVIKSLSANQYNTILSNITDYAEKAIVHNGCNLGILNYDSDGRKPEKKCVIPQLHLKPTDDFLIVLPGTFVFAINDAGANLMNVPMLDPSYVNFYDYSLLIYEDYVRVKIVSNKPNGVHDLSSYRVWLFTIPFIFWKRIYENIFFSKKFVKILITQLLPKRITNNKWIYESILRIN